MYNYYIEIVDGFSNVELVNGAENDGRSCEESEQEEQEEVDHDVAHVPRKALH